MVIFYSYVKLPEGNPLTDSASDDIPGDVPINVKTIATLAGVVPWGPSSSHPWLRCFSAMEAEGF